jgi:hypothetical protein
MHAVSGIELLENICSHLEANRDLAHAARVSRAYHGAATHILWASLDSLDPLTELFPMNALIEDELSGAAPVSSLCLPNDVFLPRVIG